MIPVAFRDRYDAGVEALARAASGLTDAQWSAPACGKWSATELAGHVVGVIGWYHHWLDRALDGDASAPFDPDDMAAQNDRALASVTVSGGPERVEWFVEEARRYAAHVDEADWDLPYGYPRGQVTVGGHFGGAATVEWHVHAWDLSSGLHAPTDAPGLFGAAAELHLAQHTSVIGRAQRALVPLASKRSPWKQMLRATGRTL